MRWRGLLLALVVSASAGAIGAAVGCSAEVGSGGMGGWGASTPTSTFTTTWMTGGVGGGTTTGTTTGTGGAGEGGIAAPCKSNGDCEAGLYCVAASSSDPIFGGGPAGGFCTSTCYQDFDCPQGSACYQLDPEEAGHCTLECDQGPAITGIAGLFDPLDPTKCLGREDLRCGKPPKASSPMCLPTCGSDAHCDGSLCDPRSAVCVTNPSSGQPLGAACDPTGADTCAGRCVGFDSAAGMCSSPCVLGGEKLGTADCGGYEKGFCAFRTTASGLGDTGYCTPSCKVQSDCPAPAFWCTTIAGLSDYSQRGYCFAATPCPGGKQDCDAAGLSTLDCTTTTLGAYCLDPAYPLGSIELADAGAPDAGDADAGAPDAAVGDAGP